MSTNDPEFYQAPKFTPEPPQPLPKQRGCFFYGCIIASILAVLFAILMVVIAFFVYRLVNQLVDQYTSTTPQELPKVEMPAGAGQDAQGSSRGIPQGRRERNSHRTLVLTSDDLNALIEDNPDLKGVIYVKIEGNEVKGQISLPLDKLNVRHGPRPVLERRSRFQGVALRRRLDRHDRVGRGQRQEIPGRSS